MGSRTALGGDREIYALINTAPEFGLALRQGFAQKTDQPLALEAFANSGVVQGEFGGRIAQSYGKYGHHGGEALKFAVRLPIALKQAEGFWFAFAPSYTMEDFEVCW